MMFAGLMVWGLATPVHAEPTSDEICVTTARTASDVRVDPIPASLTQVRDAISRDKPRDPEPVSIPELLAAIEPPLRRNLEPQTGEFGFGAGAMAHPLNPQQVLLGVASAAPDSGIAPLRLTYVIDTSPSMLAVFTRRLPPLQDELADGSYRRVNRMELAKEAFNELTRRLPDRAVVSVVVVDRGRGQVLLPSTPIQYAPRIFRAINSAGPLRTSRQALDVIGKTALEGGDPCEDARILLLTDGHARIAAIEDAQKAVGRWQTRGASMWTVSVGEMLQPTEEAAALTALGGGMHFEANVLSEAVIQLSQSLRASGVVGRNLSLTVTPNPDRVASWQRLDDPSRRGTARDVDIWTHDTVAASESHEALYAFTLRDDAASEGPIAEVAWSVGSPAPGEWLARDQASVSLMSANNAPAWLRDRAVAVTVGEAFQNQRAWSDVVDVANDLARPQGMARELAAWAHHLQDPVNAAQGGLPFELSGPTRQ